MQGLPHFIPTAQKIEYLNLLLQVGFHSIDFGSFVSPRAVPQLRDTAEVLAGLDLANSNSRLLAIVANVRGAEEAVEFDEIRDLGYPFSISDTFQLRNTNRSLADSLPLVEEMLGLCAQKGKNLVVYLSMAFGNPYGDPWSEEEVEKWAETMVGMGVRVLSLADTVGSSTPDQIDRVFGQVLGRWPGVEIGAHFHAQPADRHVKLAAAWQAGCRRFDVAANGFGGCPFAKDELVGNISTESLLAFLDEQKARPELNLDAWQAALKMAPALFH